MATTPESPGTDGDARHAARSGVVQVLTILLQAVTAATQVVFARLFGPAIYGAYQASLAVVELASRGAPAGADKAMLRYVAAGRATGDPETVRRALGTGLRLCFGASAVLTLVLALGAGPIARGLQVPALAPALRILAFLPVFAGVLLILIQASLAARVTRANFTVRGVLEPGLLLAAGVIAWALGARLRGLVFAQLLAAMATAVVALIAVRGVFRPAELRGVLRAPRLPGFSRFALTISAAEILNAALQRADILIVTAYLGAKGAAVYAAAEFLTRVIANIRYAFDSIVAGVMAESLELGDRDRLRYNLQLATRWVVSVAALLAGAVIVLRRELLGGLYGPAYTVGASAVVVLAASHFLNAAVGLVGWALIASGRSRLTLFNNILGVVVNVTLGLWLTPRLGYLGAALAALGTIVAVQAAALTEVAVTEKATPFSVALWKPLAAAAAAFAVETLVHRAVGPAALRIVAVVVSGLGVYLAVLLLVGLPTEERRWAERLRARIRLTRAA
ncbi:MAG TPA: oligosaccharide flippase family protein [Polyangia bacterium]|nr:oligosaccharide flippase family protein [Polyangia bacterium]